MKHPGSSCLDVLCSGIASKALHDQVKQCTYSVINRDSPAALSLLMGVKALLRCMINAIALRHLKENFLQCCSLLLDVIVSVCYQELRFKPDLGMGMLNRAVPS